jgi:hypothetical protein
MKDESLALSIEYGAKFICSYSLGGIIELRKGEGIK